MCWGAIKGRRRDGRVGFSLCAAVLFAAAAPSVHAVSNITSDGSLGTTVSGGPVFDISGGTIAGSNQFHSFESFSVGAGDVARFNGPANVANVISRVTGGSVSAIDGTIASTIAGANVFLLNPAGVMFGPNAQVSVDGAFHASTAGYLRLDDGSRFFVDPVQASTLTAAAPAAFGFLDANPAGIGVQGTGSSVFPSFPPRSGADIGLIGGAVTIDGAILYAPLGRINLAAVGPGSATGIEAMLTAGAVDLDGFSALGPVNIGGNSYVDTSALYIQGGQITIAGAYLSPGSGAILLGLPAPPGHVNNGLVDIRARGDLTVTPGSTTRTLIGSTLQQFFLPPSLRGAGNGATVRLEAGETLSIQANPAAPGTAVIGTDRWQTGPAGELVFSAKDIQILGTLDIYAFNHAPGPGPNTTLKAETVTVNSGGFGAINFGPGDGGYVDVSASQVTLSSQFGRAIIGAQNGGVGAGGAIIIDADSLELQAPGAAPVLISGDNFNVGSGASITLDVGELTIASSGAGRASISASTNAPGAAGSITLDVDQLSITSSGAGTAGIAASTNAPGAAGSIRIGSEADPAQAVFLQGDGALVSVSSSTGSRTVNGSGFGPAGDIDIHTGTLTQIGNTEIGASSFSDGDGGSVTIHASEAVWMTGRDPATESVISAGISAGPYDGAGGSIAIESPLLEMINATITARTERASDAGGVTLAVGTLSAANSTITSETRDDGDAGPVTVIAERITLTDGAQIRSFSGGVDAVDGKLTVGTGDAGTVTVTATESLSVAGASSLTNRATALSTQTRGDGTGGALNVTAGRLTVGQGGLIAADTGGDGDGGALTVAADTVLVDGGEISSGSGISVAIQNGQVDLLGSGEGGDVTVQADNGVTVQTGGRIAASSRGPGNAGDITVDGGSEVRLVGGSIETESLVSDGGDIAVQAVDLVYGLGGKITTSVVGAGGTGGNIDIDPEFVVLQAGSQVIANATNPAAVQAGNITITGNFILISQDSLVQASGPTRDRDGVIVLRGPDGDLTRALAQLPESYLEAAGLLKANCGAGRAGVSTLALAGRGGVPISPDRYLPGIATGVSVDTLDASAMNQPFDGERLAFGPSDPTAAGWLLADMGCR